jgi:hypothetical protein
VERGKWRLARLRLAEAKGILASFVCEELNIYSHSVIDSIHLY